MRWAIVIDDPDKTLGRDPAEVMYNVEQYLWVSSLRYVGKHGDIKLTACVDWTGRDTSIHDKEQGCPQE